MHLYHRSLLFVSSLQRVFYQNLLRIHFYIFSYDALLSSESWEDLCNGAMFHGGDGSSSGSIAASWWGLIHGLIGVPDRHHTQVEFIDRLLDVGTKLYAMSF